VFENIDPEHTWILRHTAQKVGKVVNALIEQSLKEVQTSSAAVSPFGRTYSMEFDADYLKSKNVGHIHHFGKHRQEHILP
jgi:hypothetical protein